MIILHYNKAIIINNEKLLKYNKVFWEYIYLKIWFLEQNIAATLTSKGIIIVWNYLNYEE